MTHPLRRALAPIAALPLALAGCTQPEGYQDDSPSPSAGAATTSTPGDASPAPTAPATATPEAPTPAETPTAAPTAAPTPRPALSARIRVTEGGIPHIEGATLKDAAFGHGYVFAQSHACILADQILKVTSRRSAVFGPGEGDANLDFDFGMLALGVHRYAEEGWGDLPADVQDLIVGFAAGYNRWLREASPDDYPGFCRGATWLTPITPVDLLAYYTAMGLMASGQAVLPAIARAEPPGSPGAKIPPPSIADLGIQGTGIGSNGWALGAEKTASGRGMLAANPHFPWEGELKFFEAHLKVPGKINAYGAALMGSPVPNIGFNEHVAWTHTFSWAARGTFYQLRLDPRDPTRYRYESGYKDMEATTFTIDVKGAGGRVSPLSRTLYRTHWGPLIATDEFGWTPLTALTFRDVNEGNTHVIEQFAKMAMAEDLDAFLDVHAKVHGMPWAHTMAVSPEGDAVYLDSSRVPHLSDDTIARWQAALDAGDPLAVAAWHLGAPLLDGTGEQDEWVSTRQGDATLPIEDAPRLTRRDFVFNSNDTHWLANPQSPLTGFNPLYGPERTPRSARTRMNAVALTEAREGGTSGPDGRFTLDELQAALLVNRQMMAEVLKGEAEQRCAGVTTVVYDRKPVDISEACAALTAWDGRLDLDSRGALVWREALSTYTEDERMDAGRLFSVGFDPDDPVRTPYGLYTPATRDEADPFLQALAFATSSLKGAGFALDAPLGEAQYSLKGDERIPVHGGGRLEGATNMVYMDTSPITMTSLEPPLEPGEILNAESGLSDAGYLVNYGSSFVMALEYTPEGPVGRAVLAYSQSDDPRSPHFNDQSWMFSEKRWRTLRFTDAEIDGDPELEGFTVTNE